MIPASLLRETSGRRIISPVRWYQSLCLPWCLLYHSCCLDGDKVTVIHWGAARDNRHSGPLMFEASPRACVGVNVGLCAWSLVIEWTFKLLNLTVKNNRNWRTHSNQFTCYFWARVDERWRQRWFFPLTWRHLQLFSFTHVHVVCLSEVFPYMLPAFELTNEPN